MSEITVTLRYYNIIKDAVGRASETLELPAGTTPTDVIVSLCQRYPHLRSIALRPDGRLAPHLRVFLNGQVARPQHLANPLSDGDEVMLFPAIGGG
ncbi:MAG: MoaD/ThiS family protein [Chloroflexota bacterium]|nr:MoaD/ThiS family protein [Chloroflexota bacterium]